MCMFCKAFLSKFSPSYGFSYMHKECPSFRASIGAVAIVTKQKNHHKQQQQMQTDYTILVHSSHNSWTIIFALSLNVLLV